MSRDLHHAIAAQLLLAADQQTATQTLSAVDLQGFQGVEFLFSLGDIANVANSPSPNWALKLEDSDDNVSFSAVVDSELVLYDANPNAAAPNASTGVFANYQGTDKLIRVGYIGPKRYVRPVLTASNTPGATDMTVIALKLPYQLPAEDVSSQVDL